MTAARKEEGPLASPLFPADAGGKLLAPFADQARPLRATRPNAPNVWRCQWQGQAALVKSYHHCSRAYRQTVGRLAMNREWWALQRLAQLGSAPQPLARPLPWVVVMEWVEGTPLESLQRGQVPAAKLVTEAERLLDSFARAGVVHGDLGHDCWSVQGRESNVLVTAGARLMAIDFAGSCSAGGWFWPWNRIASALQLHDQLFLTKVLYHWGDPSMTGHPGWRLPSQRTLAWWDLMKLLGKV